MKATSEGGGGPGGSPGPVPHIRGETVMLVPQDKTLHLENYLRWINDPEVTRWMLAFKPISRVEEERWFESMAKAKDAITWAVHRRDGPHIGSTGLHQINWHDRSAVSGILIGDKSAWGRGYGSEVMGLRTRWAFEELGLHRIESECFVENQASARCLEKAGYTQMGVARKRRWRAGRWHDTILWEILEEDYFRNVNGDEPE